VVAGGGLRVSRSHPGSRNGVCLLQGGQAVGGPGAVVGKGAAGGGGGDSGRVIAGLGALAVLVWKVESVFFFFDFLFSRAAVSLARRAPVPAGECLLNPLPQPAFDEQAQRASLRYGWLGRMGHGWGAGRRSCGGGKSSRDRRGSEKVRQCFRLAPLSFILSPPPPPYRNASLPTPSPRHLCGRPYPHHGRVCGAGPCPGPCIRGRQRQRDARRPVARALSVRGRGAAGPGLPPVGRGRPLGLHKSRRRDG
jgi:hypothetical protein